MTHYECCYSSGRQYVFEERRRWVVAALAGVAFLGVLVGFSIGVTVSIVGIFLFEVGMAALACCVWYLFMFQRVSSSLDISGFILGNIAFAGLFTILLGVIRCSLYFELGALNRSAIFSLGGVFLALFIYTFARLCCQEDERKHHLGLCGPGGAVLAPCSPGGSTASVSNWADLVRFVLWIFTWQWYFDLHDSPLSADEECSSADFITVHNRTLKLIKVCFYSADDLFCMVPFGGISGRCVGFIHAEERRTFNLRRRGGSTTHDGIYQLKVFQPGVFDKELACYPKAKCGQSFAFSDVEGMVRRSRLLSSAPAPPQALDPDALAAASADSSEEEGAAMLQANLLHVDRPLVLVPRPTGAGLLRRNYSTGSLQDEQATPRRGPGTPPSVAATVREVPAEQPFANSRLEVRRARPDEIVVRNRSSQEIRALLFRSDDYCYMVPLVGKLTACADCILPDRERRFNPSRTTAREFTLKVYSVGPGAKELTYLTVSRGCAYTFCDSLLS